MRVDAMASFAQSCLVMVRYAHKGSIRRCRIAASHHTCRSRWNERRRGRRQFVIGGATGTSGGHVYRKTATETVPPIRGGESPILRGWGRRRDLYGIEKPHCRFAYIYRDGSAKYLTSDLSVSLCPANTRLSGGCTARTGLIFRAAVFDGRAVAELGAPREFGTFDNEGRLSATPASRESSLGSRFQDAARVDESGVIPNTAD